MLFRYLGIVVACGLMGTSLQSVGQQTSDSANAAPSAASTAPSSTSVASSSEQSAADKEAAEKQAAADVLFNKKAKLAGFKPQTSKGTTVYCVTETNTGSRFEMKKCYDRPHLEALLDLRTATSDQLQKPLTCSGGGVCGATH